MSRVLFMISVLCMLGIGASGFLSVALFRLSSDTGQRVLSVAWPLNALSMWLAAGALLCWTGGMAHATAQTVFGVVCVFGGLLGFISAVSSRAGGASPLPVIATVVHALICGAILLVFQLALSMTPSGKESVSDKAVVWSVVLCIPLAMCAVVLSFGMASQNVAFASRFDSSINLPNINGTSLYVNCSGSGSVMALIVGDIDQTAVYYMPLQQALANEGFTACVYDSAGVGFSEPGRFPRSPQVLGLEASAVVTYLLSTYNETSELFVVGCGHGGIVARLMLLQQFDNVNGVILVDSLSEFDPQKLGAALGETPDQYVASLVGPQAAAFQRQHVTAPLGFCLLDSFIPSERFPPLPSRFSGLQIMSRCNGGTMAAASQSRTALMYSGLDEMTSLGDMPLFVCASAGPFAQPVIGQALFEIQYMLSKQSTSSTFERFTSSQISGDLVVLHIPELLSFVTPFMRSNRRKMTQ